MDIEKTSESLRSKAAAKKSSENVDQTKNRLKDAVLKRDQAIKIIEDYQDSTGIPTDDEVDGNFLENESSTDLNLDEFKEQENDENA